MRVCVGECVRESVWEREGGRGSVCESVRTSKGERVGGREKEF